MKLSKKTILSIILFVTSNIYAQSTENDYKISIVTDVNFSSSADDTRKESQSGVGTLGLRFEKGNVYGGANFTVFSQNKEIQTDSRDTKIFGTNLLIPENNSGNISSFSLLFGVNTFYLKTKNSEDLDTFSFKRFGSNLEFKVNNTTWSKDSISAPVIINTFNLNLTYLLLNAEILDTNQRIKLYVSYGLTTRRIGGDIALKSNSELRRNFLGTERLGFNGSNLGIRLEVSKFYGEMNLSSFNRKHEIAGFSGNQAIVTLGLIADLTLVAKEKGVSKKNNTQPNVEQIANKKIK